MTKIKVPCIFYLYDGSKTEIFKMGEVGQYLGTIFKKSKIKISQEFVFHYLSYLSSAERERKVDKLAQKFALIKVRDVKCKNLHFEPLSGEVEYEKRRMLNPESKSYGIVYDGFKLRVILAELIPRSEFNVQYCHIIFTNQLFATWDESDKRYHLRASIYGFPAIISTTGVVEAPAKPREFYLKQQLGVDRTVLKKEFAGRFIGHDDSLLTEVIKGYIMQATFYQMGENPFCDDRNCRLYNAHWQEELIQAQIKSPYELCRTHKRFLYEDEQE